MALQVTGDFETPFGTTISSSYWRWVGLGVDVSRLTATVTLYAYVSAEAFGEGKANIGQKTFTVEGAAFVAFAGRLDGADPEGLSKVIYDYVLSEDSDFIGAVEV